ncbi:hypothetical protein J27TS7_51890 [Paenibacillus dendritiformis]|uniref:tetratricopeptide repeat protein n=2 Tax=Paenibacillus dendritiformis TaxID=130049 RepID=UPI001B02220A|nr:transcriptional regulator [Paenibacillus dendritiformis]GIO75675.1 hypothetical protein J27TS7_51890 [Paenibacillus dendritiformis]
MNTDAVKRISLGELIKHYRQRNSDIAEQYNEIQQKPEVIFSILQNELETLEHPAFIPEIAAKFLEASNGMDGVKKLYRAIDSVQDTSIQLAVYNLIIDYSRSHGMMPYIAKGLYRKYMIERNDFSKLKETYQLGKCALDYVQFLSDKERIIFYYSIGVHADSLMNYDDSVPYMKYVVENDNSENGEYRANAYLSLCNSFYNTGDYRASQVYLNEYSKYSFSYVADNVHFMSACIEGKMGNVDSSISKLRSYLQNTSEYNLIYAVAELLDQYLQKNDLHSAKKLLVYEEQMVKSLQDIRTTPFKRALLARFYKNMGDILYHEDIEKSLDYYMKSVLEYAGIGQYDNSLHSLSYIFQAIAKGVIVDKETIKELESAIKSVGQLLWSRSAYLVDMASRCSWEVARG